MNLDNSIFSCVKKSKIIVFISILGLSGCGSDSDGNGYVKFYNASVNAPEVFLTIDENIGDDDEDDFETTYSSVEYGKATSDKEVSDGNYYYELAWQDEDSKKRDDLEIISEGIVYVKKDAIQLIVLSEDIEQPEVEIYDIEVIDDEDDVDDDLFNLRVLNLHPDSEGTDIYISKSDETFNEAELFGGYSNKELSENKKFDQDDYIFYITKSGSDEVLFQSEDINYSYPSQYVMVIRKNFGSGSSPYILDLVTSSNTTEYIDFNAEAKFQVYNGITEHELLESYKSVFDLFVGNNAEIPDISSVQIGEYSDSLTLPKGDYGINLTVANSDVAILRSHLLTLPENSNKTVFFYLKEDDVDHDGDGDVDEDGDGIVDEIEITINSLVVENSNRASIYDHSIRMVNLVDSEDFTSVQFFFVRSDETVETALNKSTVQYTESTSIYLLNNTYQVFVVAKQNSSDIVLSNFELILDEQSKEQFFVLEADMDSPTGYKVSTSNQN
ncbi:hypothetical protein D5R81_18080 [Parashewanella spongiae]|uniref:DUF4397 domain-containing protein n=1 Tax=Parashewanella spongiae TaxID=342950 RepID=A0A3A6TDP5_9GAMM|nr:hypothetical protein [Parashewanella spongiae]MCL1079950.1 hypothetical protein [Parashewanella spongiae]RJY06186.1 hypothetical protein D5R81_18080 [Parashewanella spongiae]